MSTGHRPRDTSPINFKKLNPLSVPSAGRSSAINEEMAEIVIANLKRDLTQWQREAAAWKEKHDALRVSPSPAVAPHPAAPVASGGVEVRGVVTGITPRGGFIVEPLSGSFGPRHINCHVSVRLADPTEGG